MPHFAKAGAGCFRAFDLGFSCHAASSVHWDRVWSVPNIIPASCLIMFLHISSHFISMHIYFYMFHHISFFWIIVHTRNTFLPSMTGNSRWVHTKYGSMVQIQVTLLFTPSPWSIPAFKRSDVNPPDELTWICKVKVYFIVYMNLRLIHFCLKS